MAELRRWRLADHLTGDVLVDLPIQGDDTIQQRIALVDSTTLQLNLADPLCPLDWRDQLTVGKVDLFLDVDGDLVQGWFVEVDVVGDVTVPLTCKTLEVCLERTYVPTYDQDGVDDVTAAAALCQPLIADHGFVIEHTPSTKPGADLSWDGDTEDQRLLAALNESMAAGRIEWRVGLRYADGTRRRIVKAVQIAERIGTDRPHVVFDRDPHGDGTIESYTRTTSYAEGKGATVLQGVGDGSGSARPMTDPQESSLVGAGWPRWHERKSFANTTDPDAGLNDDELLAATIKLLPARERGTVTWAVTGRDTGARPGRDYVEGDTVRVDVAPSAPIPVTGHDGVLRDGPRVDPTGGKPAVRVIGWRRNLASEQVELLLWEDDPDV